MEKRFAHVFSDNPAPLVISRLADGRIVDMNASYAMLVGWTRNELIDRAASDLDVFGSPQVREEMVRQLRECRELRNLQLRLRTRSGDLLDILASMRLLDLDGEPSILGAITDITDQVRVQRKLRERERELEALADANMQLLAERTAAHEVLEHQALHDALTGLPNRTLLQERLEQAIAHARRHNLSSSLLLLDLDRFKEINDAFGHRAGDQLLREIGPRLERLLRETDTVARPAAPSAAGADQDTAVARLGGDEFAILLLDAGAYGAITVAERIVRSFDAPFMLEDQALDIRASVGIAQYPDHGETPELLFQHAEVAMYEAKRHHTGYAVYEAAQDPYSRGRIALIADLRRAIERDELLLHYQPKLDVRTGHVLGVEALVRWQHPQEGFVSPLQIVELAEHTGLIKPLTRWVLSGAVRQCRAWLDRGRQLSVAVNLSARSLHDQQLPALVQDVVTRAGLPASALILEITETAVMVDPGRALEVVAALAGLGVRVSIDDFGTGYSSLSYLRDLPAHEVKIDKSFVTQMDQQEADWRIVRATITLAHELGLGVVAEGIETRETWNRLKDLECDAGQGYYVARPMPADAFFRWLESGRSQR